MNILIVGNGFDLSHYLPTKYDHFMVAMGAIENWDENKGEMGFDDLFSSLYEKENYFFKYTKAMYQTDEIKISIDQIKDLQEKLKENVWYQYFAEHVREVKTWIDFEQKIEEALSYVSKLFSKIEEVYSKRNTLLLEIKALEFNKFDKDSEHIYLNERLCQALLKIGLIKKQFYTIKTSEDGERKIVHTSQENEYFHYSINKDYVKDHTRYDIYNSDFCIFVLNNKLSELIDIFNFYLMLVDRFESKELINPISVEFKKVYSFNYTRTFKKFYKLDEIEFLHGSSGNTQNIVLGISDLGNDILKKHKAYGFTKYHQKLFKNTHYLFLSEDIDRIKKSVIKKKELEKYIESSIPKNSHEVDLKRSELSQIILTIGGKISIYIWGHSLDSSDASYIKEIFSFNNEIVDHHCDVTVFFFNNQAKFDLLNNLLHILGSELVEKWMKKGWLKFEPNPNILEINNIQPVDLPTFKK
ncbi:AbiH family protein [Acinetobacter sp. VNK23]|uniref:AbiH family protein n=1 Tax=Acinetobacter thutiue TaxID=2998078 RepID=UPI002577DF43|nr:AbiH family protein [Acinetobacter thutiue]MDM1019014.1 AbiH family protein [Acinetobacter thutiue]